MDTGLYTEYELKRIGFKSIGVGVMIARSVKLFGVEKIEIGDNVRIDEFCILSGKIKIGNHIHLAPAVMLFGGDDGIVIDDFCGISSRTALYTTSDDFSGEFLTNPNIPDEYRRVTGGNIVLERFVSIGTGCTIMKSSMLCEGSAFGSMSFISGYYEPWGIYAGIPCRKIKDRKKNMVNLAEIFLQQSNGVER